MTLVVQDLIHADLHGSHRMLAISLVTRSLDHFLIPAQRRRALHWLTADLAR
jgi:hypothetical protein